MLRRQRIAIRNCSDEGGDDGNQRHRAYFSDRLEFRTLPRVLSQAAAVSRAEAGHRHRRRPITASAAAPRSAISAPSPEHAGAAFEQKRVGLHHLCFRARERADIDELHGFLCTLGVKIIRAPREDQWAPGYYSLLFEDPDGIRLELNHVPGKGLVGRECERAFVASRDRSHSALRKNARLQRTRMTARLRRGLPLWVRMRHDRGNRN